MDFVSAVKRVQEGKLMKRTGWDGFHRLIQDDYGVLQIISFRYIQSYEATLEDVLAHDWVEVKKEKYVVHKAFEVDGLQHFVLDVEKPFILDEDQTIRRDELLTLSKYVEVTFADECKTFESTLTIPQPPEFDYNYHQCPLCQHAISFAEENEDSCPNGCVSYDVDPQGETVSVQFFDGMYDEDSYLLNLEPEGWNRESNYLKVNLKKFQEIIRYWKENDRYLKRLEKMNQKKETPPNV